MNNGPLFADFAAIVRAHPDGVLVITDSARIVFSNAAGMALLCRFSDAFGHIPAVLDIAAGHATRASLLELTGEEVVLDVRAHRVEWRGRRARALYVRDVTAEVHERRTLEELVYRDHLTGLYNRRGLEKCVAELLHAPGSDCRPISMLYIDINGLKQVNDTLGHCTGDAMIQETAGLLSEVFGPDAIKARMGGDEFVVFVMGRSPAWVEESIGLLRSTADACNRLPGRRYELSLSVGLTHYPSRPPHDIQGLIERADNSMYQAKQETAHRHVHRRGDSAAQDSRRSAARASITKRQEASR